MTWILIYALMSAAGSISSGSVEFNTQKACESAAQDMQDQLKGIAAPFCVAKGAEAEDVAVTPAPAARPSAPVVAKAPKASP